MFKTGFDNDRYIQMQSAHIKERIAQFGGKLYLEFGGKLYDDYHASRVLPGFQPDSKLRMLLNMKEIPFIPTPDTIWIILKCVWNSVMCCTIFSMN